MDSSAEEVLTLLPYLGVAMSKKKGPRFLDRQQAARYIGMSFFWMQKYASSPEAPYFVKHRQKSWYRKADLDAWLSKTGRLGSPSAMLELSDQMEKTTEIELHAAFERAESGRGSAAVLPIRNAKKHRTATVKFLSQLLDTFTPEQRVLMDKALNAASESEKNK